MTGHVPWCPDVCLKIDISPGQGLFICNRRVLSAACTVCAGRGSSVGCIPQGYTETMCNRAGQWVVVKVLVRVVHALNCFRGLRGRRQTPAVVPNGRRLGFSPRYQRRQSGWHEHRPQMALAASMVSTSWYSSMTSWWLMQAGWSRRGALRSTEKMSSTAVTLPPDNQKIYCRRSGCRRWCCRTPRRRARLRRRLGTSHVVLPPA